MNKVRNRLITILSFFALAALTLGCVFGMTTPLRRADAATYAPSSVFAAGSGVTVGVQDAEEGEDSYVQFAYSGSGKTYYRRNLALKWQEAAEEAGSSVRANPSVAKYFTMTFSFPAVEFEKFEISFESTEENISKAAKSTNSILFLYEENALSVAVKNASQQDLADDELTGKVAIPDPTADLTVSFTDAGRSIGEFEVLVNGVSVGVFTNIGGNYLEYRSSSSTTPNTPITFAATLPTGSDNIQYLLMKNLNGQNFVLDDGRVTDNASPVLVLNETVYAFTLGQRFSLTYQAIDVCDDSVSVTRSYYMLKKDEDGKYVTPDETTSDDYKTLTTSTYFLPPDDSSDEAKEYVSIRLKLDDGTTDPVYSYVTWYAADSAVATLGEAGQEFDYLLVDREKEGPYYIGISPVAEEDVVTEDDKTNVTDAAKYQNWLNGAVKDYQEALDETAQGLSAGSGAYIYLPSMRGLFASDYADYRNLKFSIYYYKSSASAGSTASSSTSLSYNALKLEIDEAGLYRFRVLATDASGNAVKLWVDGELTAVTSSNIWDIDEIPEFTFEVGYDGAIIEDPGEQDEKYLDSSSTFESFDIIALSGYETDYTLYRIDADELPEGESLPSYSDFVKNLESFMTDEKYEKCLVEIQEYQSQYTEDDAAWERTDNDYNWNPSSGLSFTPQKTGYYVLQVIVTDSVLPGYTATGYQAVYVRNPIDTIPGDSQWLQNNVTSVVLFAISGVLAIAIVVLIVVKPAEKNVEEVNLEKLKGQKRKNGKK